MVGFGGRLLGPRQFDRRKPYIVDEDSVHPYLEKAVLIHMISRVLPSFNSPTENMLVRSVWGYGPDIFLCIMVPLGLFE